MASPGEAAPDSVVHEEAVSPPPANDSTAMEAIDASRPDEKPAATEDDAVNDSDEAAQLADLGAGVRDQDDLERAIGQQADQLLIEQADERDKKRLEKTQKDRDRLLGQVKALEKKVGDFGVGAIARKKHKEEIEHYTAQIKTLDVDLEQIQRRMAERAKNGEEAEQHNTEDAANKRLPGESQREFLIRTGKITPFSKMGRQLLKTSSSLGDVLLDAEEEGDQPEEDVEAAEQEEAGKPGPVSHRNLLAPGFEQDDSSAAVNTAGDTDGDAELARKLQDEEFATSGRPTKRRRLQSTRQARAASEDTSTPAADESDTFEPDPVDAGPASDEDAMPDGEEVIATTPGIRRKGKGKRSATKRAAAEYEEEDQEDLAGIDDGNEQVYQARLQSWVRRRSAARRKAKGRQGSAEPDEAVPETEDDGEEWTMPHPSRTDAEFEGGYRIPGDIYPSLFDYQKTGVQWLWELYSQQVGGIIGDEMGLGKTIQVIAFLAGLHYSGKLKKPIIIVCPATVMKQWVNEFHRWWPPLRVSILHTSGSGMLDVKREARIEDELEDDNYSRRSTQSKGHKSAKRILDRVARDGHVLVTTYSGLQTYAELLIPTDWEYAVLDEGHKIRNPNTAITIYCKELRTHNRIILSGTPMQNNLTELWSLFDFIFPMRLGTLVNFRNQFEIPIKQGGYANASNLQVETAMKCAETLKDTISPYLLQRFKVDVATDLPKKSERVLFCKLTKLQRDAYEWFLASEEMKSIMAGKRQALYGVDILRKICNHPDLVEHRTLSKKSGYVYGSGHKSGKMQVVKALLETWKKRGHKTLLFAQHRIMLDILEKFIQNMDGFRYVRMDGSTNIKDRQDLVDDFNRDPDLHVFLLTTKVGGLGVNLTGADRVIIYDPDWNPSTDVQARERAWRLGQKREVEIYRLMTAGTIEEKIYHRQIFKQFLTNKILRDPKQRQTFQLKDLHDLFTLGDAMPDGQTETGMVFKGTEVQLSKGREERGLPTPPEDQTASNRPQFDDVTGISRQEEFRTGDEDDTAEGPASAEASTKDDRMLSSIFARTGVQSALEHDAIINGRKTVRADPEIIAREARRVASQAAKELQRAGEVARTIPAGVPTWTGVVGSAGRPEFPPPASRRGGASARGRGGPSSASVLANLAARQPVSSPAASSSRTANARSDRHPKGKDFLILIRDYLVAQGGKAYTQMLIDHFNRFCRTEQRTAEFKEMLKAIATLEKGGRGRGMWVLKEEYKPGNVAQ
ncbi:DNA repair protein rhp26 [Saxophila tyrrhenica]|uniref:DNA repair protein rhp26 n=1 Tax=Saxophila tyrrhenica TaxID=1690608 RepID=A0AAV9PC34_9PEZI|nr:DNA repair protein rhp26 [Saxophila tyrrhenica]